MPENAGTLTYTAGTATRTGSVTVSNFAVDESVNATAALSGGAVNDTITLPVTIGSTNYADSTVNVIISLTDRHTQTITASDVTATYGDTDKKVSATTDGDGTLSYAVKSGDAVTVDASSGALTTVKAGTATVTVTAAETDTYKQAARDVTVTVDKAAPTVTAPTAKTLTYTGSAQELANAGSTNDGKLYYAVTSVKKAPTDDSLYTTSIPTATDTGTWYVWYRVEGDGNHKNYTASAPVTVTIGQVNKDALNDAIRAAEAFYAEIKENAAYAGIAETLKNAIDAARPVANDANVTEDQVKAAAGSVAEAEKTAKADKDAVDKAAADKAAAKTVEDLINALPDSAGLADRDAIDAARAAYDALTNDQKKLIGEGVLAKLTAAEEQVRKAEEEARKVNISDCTLTVKGQTYTGKALEPAVTVKYGKTTLKKGTDYTVTYKNNVNPGTATATVKGKGNYTGSAEVTFAIRVPLSKCKLTVKNQAYTGKALESAVTVKYGKATLKKDTDYTVTYADNVKPGTATATVKGKGKYTGSAKISFKITLKGTAFTKLTGGNRQITLHWNNQKNVTGYEIQYSLKKSFPDKKTVKIEKAATLTATIGDLKANKTYYVRIRTYTTVEKKNYYSAWSKTMTVNTEAGKAKNASNAQAEEMEALTPGGLVDDGLLPDTGDIDGEVIVMDAA